MIIDKLSNRHLYYNLGERIKTALEYLANTDLKSLPKGKYEIDGNKIFAAVSEYQTKNSTDSKPEGHLKYIDVQYIVSGSELMGYFPLKKEKPSVEYNQEKDVMFFDETITFVKAEEGMFTIFFPEDIHQPCISTGKKDTVKKVVVKVLV